MNFVGGLLEQVKLTKDRYGTQDRMVGLLTVVQEVGSLWMCSVCVYWCEVWLLSGEGV